MATWQISHPERPAIISSPLHAESYLPSWVHRMMGGRERVSISPGRFASPRADRGHNWSVYYFLGVHLGASRVLGASQCSRNPHPHRDAGLDKRVEVATEVRGWVPDQKPRRAAENRFIRSLQIPWAGFIRSHVKPNSTGDERLSAASSELLRHDQRPRSSPDDSCFPGFPRFPTPISHYRTWSS